MQRSTWIGVALALALVGMAVPAVRHLREAPPAAPPVLRLTLGPPASADLGTGDDALDAAISPDETRIVFVATAEGVVSLWLRSLGEDTAEALPGTEGAQLPAWTPAGDAVSFFAQGQLRLLALSGGPPSDLADAPAPAGATWLPDGSVLFSPQARGVLRRLRDGELSDATTLRAGDRAHVYPMAVSLSGAFVYTSVAESGRRTVRLVRDGRDTDLTATAGHGQLVGDVLLSARDGVVLAQRLAAGTDNLEGRAIPLASPVAITSSGRALFTASRRLLLTAASTPRTRALTWFDFDGRPAGATGDPGDFWQVRLSPDDAFVAVTMVAPLLRTLDVAVVSTRSGVLAPVTRALPADTDPVWAPDGARLLFRSLQSGEPDLFSKAAHDPDGADAPLLDDAFGATPTDWVGRDVLAHAEDPQSGDDIWLLDTASGTRTPIVTGGFNDRDGRWSPGRRWLAYVSDESGQPDIYAQPWPEGNRVRVSFAGGTHPRWSRDGSRLFFLRASRIMRASRDGDSSSFAPAVAVVDAPGLRDFDVAHRSDRVLALLPVSRGAVPPVAVTLDWRSALPAGD